MEYVAGMTQLLTEKAVTGAASSDVFQRLVAETTMTMCAVLNVFQDDISGITLGVIIRHLCTWVAKDDSASTRSFLYTSLLYLMNFTRDKKVDGSIHSSFALLIDSLCKDAQKASDIGKIQSMYLLGQIIRWNMSKGLGGIVPLAIKEMEEELGAKKLKQGIGLGKSFNTSRATQFADQSFGNVSGVLTDGFDSSASISSPLNKSVVNGTDRSVLTGLAIARTSHLMHSTEAALTSYLHSRGFVKNVVLSLSGEDDAQLVHLFSPYPGNTHLRAMIIHEAKMFMLCRFASSGSVATQLLLDSSLMRSLLDMQVFYSGLNLEAEQQHLSRRSFNRSTFNKTNQMKMLPTKLERLDDIFTNVLMLFHAMIDTKPKNDTGDTLIPAVCLKIAL
jgi:hypothetical protein